MSHVDEGIEVLPGVVAGAPSKNGGWEKGSINRLVDDRLQDLGRRLRDWGKASDRPTAEIVSPVASGDHGLPEPPKPPDRPER